MKKIPLTDEEFQELCMQYIVGDYDQVMSFDDYVSFAIRNKFVPVPVALKGVKTWETDEKPTYKETY